MRSPNYLKILKLLQFKWLVLSGIWAFHVLGKRYIGIYIDPALACNLRCKMCYFSDDAKRKELGGSLGLADMRRIAASLFHRALKVQIGCGAEPTVSSNWIEVVKLARQHGVPYVSLTTNGNLLTREKIEHAIEEGLDEITLSAHGMTRATYETLMQNAKFDIFLRLTNDLKSIKRKYPNFKVRVNYTINRDNFDELAQILKVMDGVPDIIQIRPIQKIGNSEYNDFDLTYIFDNYDKVITPLVEKCRARGIECIYPQRENLVAISETAEYDNRIEEATYCYISSQSCWKPDFDFHNDTFESYSKRTLLARRLFSMIFHKPKNSAINTTRKLNYTPR